QEVDEDVVHTIERQPLVAEELPAAAQDHRSVAPVGLFDVDGHPEPRAGGSTPPAGPSVTGRREKRQTPASRDRARANDAEGDDRRTPQQRSPPGARGWRTATRAFAILRGRR